jgi:hypothetical protein
MLDTGSRYIEHSPMAAGEPLLLTDPGRNRDGSFSFMNPMNVFHPFQENLLSAEKICTLRKK